MMRIVKKPTRILVLTILVVVNLATFVTSSSSSSSSSTSSTPSPVIIEKIIAHEKIFCDSPPGRNEEEVFNYDCSRKNLTKFSLIHLIDHIRGSTSLNLADNSLGAYSPVLEDLSFNLFKQLRHLNLSSNGLAAAKLHAFFFVNIITETVDTAFIEKLDPSQLNPLRLVTLDLSRNNFERIPWNSLRSLPALSRLYLDRNPIRALDLGDWTPSDSTQPPPIDSLIEYDEDDDSDEENDEPAGEYLQNSSSKRLIKFFRNLTEIYARSTLIEHVDARLLAYLVRLRLIDLADNRIRHLSVDLRRPLEHLPRFAAFYVDRNPLVCDCHLTWLKEFLDARTQRALADGGSLDSAARMLDTLCEINTEASDKNLVVETKVIYINSTYKQNENYFKLTSINHLKNENRGRSIGNKSQPAAMRSTKEMRRLAELSAEQLYCDLDLSGQVQDLTLLSERTHYRQEVEITCRVRSYPEGKIKWVSGQRDLDKIFTAPRDNNNNNNNNYDKSKHFKIVDVRAYNATERLFTVDSKLTVTFAGHIVGKVNFSCGAFYLSTPPIFAPSQQSLNPQPHHLSKTIQFNINSDHDKLGPANVIIDGDVDDDEELLINSTMVMMREAGYRGSTHERPLIYWLLLGVCVLFALLVILFVSVFMIRHYAVKKRKQREAEASQYAYSTYTASNYSTINKRSVMYLNTNQPNQNHYHHLSTGGSRPQTASGLIAQELSSSSSAMIPLKPDVIREHKEHSSIYYRMSSNSPLANNKSNNNNNEYYSTTTSTPNTLVSIGDGTPIHSTDTTTIVYTSEPGRTLRSISASSSAMAAMNPPSHRNYNNQNSLISRANVPTTPSTTEESVSSSSSSSSSKTDSNRSSKSFEENIDEYLEPEQPDLSKPQAKQQSSHKNSPTNL